MVYIEQQQAVVEVVAPLLEAGLVEQADEMASIPQTGQMVARGGQLQLVFQALLLGHIVDDGEHQALAIQLQRPSIGLHIAQAAIGHAVHEIERAVAAGEFGHLIHDGQHIAAERIDFPGVLAAERCVVVAVEAAGGQVGIDDPTVGRRVDQDHRRAARTEQLFVETVFPLLQRGGGRRTGQAGQYAFDQNLLLARPLAKQGKMATERRALPLAPDGPDFDKLLPGTQGRQTGGQLLFGMGRMAAVSQIVELQACRQQFGGAVTVHNRVVTEGNDPHRCSQKIERQIIGHYFPGRAC